MDSKNTLFFIQKELTKQFSFTTHCHILLSIIGNSDESFSPAPYCGSRTAWTPPPHASEAELYTENSYQGHQTQHFTT